MKTKIFAILFTFSVGVGTLYSQTVISVGAKLSWNLSNGTLTISGNGAMNDFNYDNYQPHTIKESPWYSARASIKRVVINSGVTSIGNSAFYGCSGLTSVTIPNSVTSIGKGAFCDCTSLTSIDIPNSVTSIGSSAFRGCSGLTSVTIPNSVTSIGGWAFQGCSGLTGELIIPNSVTNIESCAFCGCSSLTSITIPNSVTNIGWNAFGSPSLGYCTALTRVNITDLSAWCNISFATELSNPLYFAQHLYLNGVEVKNLISPSDITSIGNYAFYGCTGLTGELVIPNSVNSIGSYAFSGCTGLTSVTIPNGVTSIGKGAFSDCTSLTGELIIPNSVTSIGESAFSGCSGLTGELVIPNSVTSIGSSAFQGCSGLTSVTIGNSVTSIGGGAFYGCSGLTGELVIPNSVNSIGNAAFKGCSIISVIWEAKNCNSYNFGNQVTSFAFGKDVEVIPSSLCSGMNQLLSITIPNSCTSIGSSAFQGCSGLTSVTIPNSVTTIGSSAFQGCSGLTSVTIGNSVTSIGNSAFKDCSSLTGELIIPNSVTSIGESAFEDCSGLTGELVIPNSVTSIGGGAFYGCSGLTSVTIPNSVTTIGESAFQSCSGLTSVTIPNSVTTIGSYAFCDCSGLTSVTIPNSVTSIGNYAFCSCDGLTGELIIPNSVTSIGKYAFGYCTGLTSVTIPNSVTSIGESAFIYCSGFTAVTCLAITPPELAKDVFRNLQCSTIPLYVPNSSVKAYKKADQWKDFTTIIGLKPVYTIIFKDWDGTILKSEQVEEGTIPEYTGPTPTRIETAKYTYTFAGWTPNVVAVTGDATYIATYTATRKSYTITWLNEDGSLIDKTTVEYGKTPTHANPTKAATAEFTYTFAGWTPNVVAVTGDATYTATFNSTVNKYNISVNAVDGSVNGGGTYPYGTQVKLTAVPNYGYHFTQWSDGNTENPRTFVLTRDTTFTAEFEKNSYTISTQSANPEWGTTAGDKSALYLENVVISATANYGYHFVRWNDNNTENPRTISVTKDATYTATFAKKSYSITKIANSTQGTISGVSNAEYLDNVTLTVYPNYGYHFTQWNDGNTDNPRTFVLTQDTTFTAEFAIDKSGTCGKDNLLQWTFADDGTLTISGSGELTENYTFGVEAPTQMQQLVIGNEVTAIGERAFYEKNTLQKLIIGSNVISIGKYAFASINNRQLTSLVMPAELLTIGDYAFSGNTYLESIDFNAKLQSIGAYAFKDCYRVSEMTCLATVTPNVGTDALASINSYASLCVPAECLRKYRVDPNWGRFDLCELGASSTTIDGKTVIVEPSDNTALFTWPTENNAASYTLQISKDGDIFCTLVFNSNGQLTGIAFAPGRNGAAHAPAATMSVAGMSFTVTGLNGASKYAYRLAVTNDASEELVAYSGEFATTGYNGEVNPGENPTGIEDIFIDEHKASKILRDGQILILRGEKVYTLTGQEVR